VMVSDRSGVRRFCPGVLADVHIAQSMSLFYSFTNRTIYTGWISLKAIAIESLGMTEACAWPC